MAGWLTGGSSVHVARGLLAAVAVSGSLVLSGLSAQASPAPANPISTMAGSGHAAAAKLPPHNLLLCDGSSVPAGSGSGPQTVLPSLQAVLTNY